MEDDPMVSAVEQWLRENPPLTIAAWQSRATAAEAREAKLRAIVRMYLDATPEHDYSCGVGPIYRCTCDLHEANEAARAALQETTNVG